MNFITAELKQDYDYLAPDGSEIRLLPSLPGGGLCHCTLPADRVSQAVYHKVVDETWFFLSGEGEVWRRNGDCEQVVSVGEGTCLTILAGTSFQFRNGSTKPLKFVITTVPCWPGSDEAVPVDGYWTAKETDAAPE